MNEPFSHICDRCGFPIEGEELRYIVKIQVYAAPSKIIISEEELNEPKSAIVETLEQCKEKSAQDHMDDVYKEFQKDLCRRCQQDYIRNPIPEVER
ncbi:MAG: hypothetical protein ACPGVU_26200 [Limisphaerales bacterium]